MGEAKRRGTKNERVAAAVARQEERDRVWNAAQVERRRQRLESEAKAATIRPRESPKSTQNRMLIAAALAAAGMSAMYRK